MGHDRVCRWLCVAVMVSSLSISAYCCSGARRSGETIARREEGRLWMSLRAAFALVVVPAEEENSIAQFGDEYRVYQERTEALLPRLRGNRSSGLDA